MQGHFDEAYDLIDSGASAEGSEAALKAAVTKLEQCVALKAQSGIEFDIEQSAQNPDYLLANAHLEIGMRKHVSLLMQNT